MIKFTKMHGLGNDYVYVNTIEKEIKNKEELAKFVSNRNFGIGSDGLILIAKSDVADFKMEMFNSDGSRAEMCGNGIRCVGKFVYDNKLTQDKKISIETLAGIKILDLYIDEITNLVNKVTVDMGEPILNPQDIPVISKEKIVQNLNIKVLDKEFIFTCVSMGNPHAITKVESVKDFSVEEYGSKIEVDEKFPNRVNVEFIEIIDSNNIKMRVWERGAGETLACGTGACAVAVSTVLNEIAKKDEIINIKLLGGNLEIMWSSKNNHVYMTGGATTVFTGELNDETLNNIG